MRSPVHSTRLALTALSATLLAIPASDFAVIPSARLIPYAAGFEFPLAFIQDPTDARVQFVVQQGGRIRTVVSGVVQPQDFLDLRSRVLSGGEQGLLGMAFPPDAAVSRRVYVNYTNLAGDTVVARFTRASNPLVADPSTEFELQWSTGARVIAQPFANHNGGCLVFGPDGFLYVGMGDGGSGDDPDHRAQDPASLLGKMLRIDVAVPDSDPRGFRIPPGNPFVSTPGYRPEIWDIGLRNPWRFSFDSPARGGTGALIIGDVGQNHWEEIDYEPAGRGGRNYGWRNREGANDYIQSRPPLFAPLIDPVYQYDHDTGQSITGGYVYRGRTSPALDGRYFFADFIRGRLWSAAIDVDPSSREGTFTDVIEHTSALRADDGGRNFSSFGEDADGELYAVDYGRGEVLRIAQGPARRPRDGYDRRFLISSSRLPISISSPRGAGR